MKKTLSIITVLFGVLWSALPLASARTLYTEDWGNTNAIVRVGNVAGSLNQLGWTADVSGTGAGGPYVGIYNAGAPNDPQIGTLTANNLYFTSVTPAFESSGPAAMFYTTSASNAPAYGNIFTNLDPTVLTNLTLNIELNLAAGGASPDYFAVQVGGAWYAATNNQFPTAFAGGYTNFYMLYTNTASVWSTLTMDPNGTFVTIGGTAGADLSGPITGVGVVVLTNSAGGYNYNRLVINQGEQDFPTSPATNSAAALSPLAVYAGSGVTFAPTFTGTPTITFNWQTNGVNIGNGANVANGNGTHYLGAQTTRLTITNISANDAVLGITNFSATAVNNFGKATNSGINLTIVTTPPSLLYAELFPGVGPTGNNSLQQDGWVVASAASNNGGGAGVFGGGYVLVPGTAANTIADEYTYNAGGPAPGTGTNAVYTTINNDTGMSGLPFPVINPASYPAVTFQCGFSVGSGNIASVAAYWIVQMSDPVAGTNWYSSSSPIAILGGYLTNQLAFSTASANWNNLTIAGNVVTFGSPSAGSLVGNITGAGMVFTHTAVSGINFRNFEIITNAITIIPPTIGTDYPIDLGVPSGGGASFGVATVTGSQPFGYYWKTNNVLVQNGGRVSGATNATLTIANLNVNDSGMQIIAFVTNSAGTDESDNYLGNPTMLTVTNPPVGLLYSEAVPFVGPVSGNYSISSIGWAEAVSGTPYTVFRSGTAQTTSQGQGAIFAYLGNAGTTVYYTTTATDTNQAGLPFPNINLASYTNLNFSVDIAPNSASSTNVTAYLAVQLNGANWYVSTSALLGPNAASNSVYSTYAMAFSPAAANWKSLTVTPGTGGIIGSAAAGNLSGVMTGSGLVFVTINSGGTFNFDNFIITGTGIGGVNASLLANGNVNLTWVGNPAVNVQSTTNLTTPNWQDVVPSTLGLYSLPVSVTNPPVRFFRLVQH